MTAPRAPATHIEFALPMHETTIDTPVFDPDNTVLDPPSPQKRDYVWLTFLPFIGVHLLCFGALWTGARPIDWVVCAVLYFVRVFGVMAGYHRYFSHRTFKTSRWFQFGPAGLAQRTVR